MFDFQNNKKLNYCLGAVIGTHVSGNAQGEIYDLLVSLYNGKSLLSLGACIQKRSNSICGARASFCYIVSGRDNLLQPKNEFIENEKLQLYFFSYLQYIYKARLSLIAIKREEILSQRNDNCLIDFNTNKFSTIECGLGFGLNVKLRKQLVWYNIIGLGIYYHTNFIKQMYADQIAPTLVIGTSLGLIFFKAYRF